MSYNIRVFNKISEQGLKLFQGDSEFNLDENNPANPDGILVRSSEIDVTQFPDLLAVARAGAGVNNINVDKASQAGVCVFNTPGANANAVAELVFIMLGIAARNIHKGIAFAESLITEAEDTVIAEKIEKGKSAYRGFELAGKTLGVIGLGKIGVLVANAGIERGMTVIGYDPFPTVANIHYLSSKVEMTHRLDDILKSSDILTAHVPLNAKTRNLIDAKAIDTVRNGCICMNFAREGIYDDQAVIAGLNSGKLDYYLSDFPSKVLLSHPKVLCTPHLGASTAESEENCAIMASRQLKNYLQYGIISNSVNFPTVDAFPHEAIKTRLIVVNKDVPNMIADITSVLGRMGININALTNESNGKLGYNIIDLQSGLPLDAVNAIRGLEGVVRVRTLNF